MGQYRKTPNPPGDSLPADNEQECIPLEKGSVTLWLMPSTLAVTMCGSFQFGYQLGVLTGPSKMMQQFYNDSNYDRRGEYLSKNAQLWLWSTTLSILCIGGAIGAFIASHMANFLGRKGAILAANVFSILGGALMGLSYVANSYEMVIIGRLLLGCYVGISLTIVPVYLAEIAPVNLRGAVGMAHQFMTSSGIITGQAFGLFFFDYESGWPIVVAFTSVPSVLQLMLLPFCPESPRWLFIRAEEEQKAEKVLKKLRGTDDVNNELVYLRKEKLKSMKTQTVGILRLLRLENPGWKRPLIITAFINVLQQLAGINAIIFYLTEIFYQAGMNKTQVAYCTVGTGAVSILMAIVAFFCIDSAGRHPLLFYPYTLMAVCTALLTVSLNLQEWSDIWKWVSVTLIYVYVIAFAVGPGPVPNVLVPELWTQGPRSAAVSLAIQTKWLANFVIGLAFPYLQDVVGAYAFLVFLFFCLLTAIFICLYVPETKGRTFQDIADNFDRDQTPDGVNRMNPSYCENT